MADVEASYTLVAMSSSQGNVPPSQVSTVGDGTATQELGDGNLEDAELGDTELDTAHNPPKLVVKNVFKSEHKLLFQVGLSSAAWLRHEQVRDKKVVQEYIRSLSADWEKFILDQEIEEASSLELNECGEEMDVSNVR